MSVTQHGECTQRSDCNIRLLFAEDIETTRHLLLTAFEDYNYRIDLAVDGRHAVNLFRQRHYDLVLTDVHMPVLDGIRAATKMRAIESQQPERQRTPIIIITAETDPAYRDAYWRAGIDLYLYKPIHLKRLTAAIEHLLQSAAREHAEPSSAESHTPTFDLEKSLTRLRGDMQLFCRLIEFFVDDYRHLVAEIERGRRQRSRTMIQRSAHTLKGMASNFSAERVEAAALAVEQLACEGEWDQAADKITHLKHEVAVLLAALQPYRG